MSSASDSSVLATAAGASTASSSSDSTGSAEQTWWQDHQSATVDAPSSSSSSSSPGWAATTPTSTSTSAASSSDGGSDAAWWADHQSGGGSASTTPTASTSSGLSGSTSFSNPTTPTADTSSPAHDWWQSQTNTATSEPAHTAADSINSQITGSDNGWPTNANGEYLVIDVTIVPNANVDLTTIFKLTAETQGIGQGVNYDLVSQQLSHISENTYVDISYYWDSKPGLIVNMQPLFNIDNDVFTAINCNPNDVNLNTGLDITQVAVPTSDAAVTVNFDPHDSNHDGVYFNVNVDTSLSVAVDQALNAYIDALQHA